MIIKDQVIQIKWGKKNRKYYVDKGYKFTKFGDLFDVHVLDLPDTSQEEILVACDSCGEIIKVKYYRYINSMQNYGNYYCIHCSQKRTLAERQNKIYQRVVDFCQLHGYELITKKNEITSNESFIRYICPVHGLHETTVKSIIANKICYKCSRQIALKKKWDKNLHERQLYLYSKILDVCNEKGYKLITKQEEIKGYNTYIVYECPVHGQHRISIGNILSGKGCPECWKDYLRAKNANIKKNKNVQYKKTNRLSPDEVERRIAEFGGVLLNKNDYVNNTTRNLQILCPRCGEMFVSSLVLFTQHGGQVCKNCYKKESNGERIIRLYLEKHNIHYIQEYWFCDCRDINPLPFDFYIPNMRFCIEFDGKQHFSETHYFNCSFGKIQLHDLIKNKYCKENDIELLRIPYWNIDKIEIILNNYFK